MDDSTRKLLEQKIAQIEKQGHGEITLKIKNGIIWRILVTDDILLVKGGDYASKR